MYSALDDIDKKATDKANEKIASQKDSLSSSATSKAKEEAMNLKDAGLDKVEYVADRVHQVAEQEKSKK